MIDLDVHLVVLNLLAPAPNSNLGTEYLDFNNKWTKDYDKAYLYSTAAAFTHAEEFGGVVYLRTKTREIEVIEKDFF